MRKTEGWPAALYLATVELRDQADLAAAVERFGGDDAIVADYLRDEVLVGPFARRHRRSSMRASILDRLSGPVCDAVLERDDSARVLSALGRASSCSCRSTARTRPTAVHGLLAEMLRAELRRREPEEERVAALARERLVRRARRRGPRPAPRRRGGDVARAAELLRAQAPAYVTQRRSSTLRRWLSSFTPEQLAAHPELALAVANSHLLEGELDGVARWESAARRTLARRRRSGGGRRRSRRARRCSRDGARDGVVRMGEDAARAYELEPEDSPWRPLCCLLEGVASHLTGDRDAAERRARGGRAAGGRRRAERPDAVPRAARAARGRARRLGERRALRARARSRRSSTTSLDDYPTSALVFAAERAACGAPAAGWSRRRRTTLDEAARLVGHAHRLRAVVRGRDGRRAGPGRGAAERRGGARASCSRVPSVARAACRTHRVLHEWIEDARAQLGTARSSVRDPASLTTARAARSSTFLPTHLSFREIAGRLYVSANTVKTQAHAVYRKLDAASRSEAVARAAEIGLLDFDLGSTASVR